MSGSGAVKRFVFKELKEGDLRKFSATSADANSGGGARDQRFSPWDKFDAVFAAMFKDRETRRRKDRDGSEKELTVYASPVAVDVHDTGGKHSAKDVRHFGGADYLVQTLRYWPPTKVRPNEGRLGEVSKLGLVPPSGKDRVFLLLFEDDTAISPRIAFLTEQDVRNGLWEKSINDFFLRLLDEPATGKSTMGYKDLTTGAAWTKAT